MSKRYLLLAQVGNTMRFFSFRTNAAPRVLGRSAWRVVEAVYGKRLREVMLIGEPQVSAITRKSAKALGLGTPLRHRHV